MNMYPICKICWTQGHKDDTLAAQCVAGDCHEGERSRAIWRMQNKLRGVPPMARDFKTAPEPTTTESARIAEAVEAERERCQAVLNDALNHASLESERKALCACIDGIVGREPEPPARKPMTISRARGRLAAIIHNTYENHRILEDVVAELVQEQARRDAEACSALAESSGTTLSHTMGCRDCEGAILKAAGLE